MRSSAYACIAVLLLAALMLPSDGWGQGGRRGRRDKRARAQLTQTEAPKTPPPGERPPAALRVECSEGLSGPLCDAVKEAAAEAAGRSYRLLEQRRIDELFAREPALRACRLEECRVAITDQLSVPRLIDVHIHSGARGGLIGSVSIYDAVAKGISGDTDAPLGRRDEKHVRKVIGDAVEYVIGSQRLTATLHLDVQPEGATVRIDDKDRGAVRTVKLFLGPHWVRVEKVGYLPVERTVNVTPAGSRESFRLQPRPIPVKIEILPPGTRVLVDGDPVDARTNVVELVEGKHRVQALPPRDSGYDALDFEIDVRVGMPPIRRVLPRLAQLRIEAPLGYSVRVDNQLMAPGRRRGLAQLLTVNAGPGTHTVAAESWRGRTLSATAHLVPGTAADIRLRAPSLIPGAVLAGAGLLGLAGGAVMLGLHGECSVPDCFSVYDFSWELPPKAVLSPGMPLPPPRAAYVTFALSSAAIAGGIVWFAVNAADHPLFNKRVRREASAVLVPVLTASGGALVVQGGF